MQLTTLFKGLLSVSIAAAAGGAYAQNATANNPYTEGTDAAKIQNQPTIKAQRKASGDKKMSGHHGEAQVSGPSGTVTRDMAPAATGATSTTNATGSSGAAGSTGSGAMESTTSPAMSPATGAGTPATGASTAPVTGTSSEVGGSAGTVSGAVGTGTSAPAGSTNTGTTTTPPAQP